MDYLDADAVELARAVRQRNVSPEELLRCAISRLAAVNPHLNAIVHTEFDRARTRAQDPTGEGPLSGVPSLIKANGVQWAGTPDAHASRAFSHVVATGSDAIVQAMEAAGLNLFGLTNSPEFALGPSTEPELFGPTRNPWDPTLSPGGSSGGAAAAVASGIVPLAHASDGGGSIRVPASACGLVGFKPSRGWTIGRRDAFAFGVHNVLSRTVRDCAAGLSMLTPPEGPPHPVIGPRPPATGRDRPPIALIPDEPILGGGYDAACAAARDESAVILARLGYLVKRCARVEIGPPDRVMRAFLLVQSVSLAVALDATGADLNATNLEPRTWATYLRGRACPHGDVVRALECLRHASQRMAGVFQHCDVLVTPTLTRQPWRIGQLALDDALVAVIRALTPDSAAGAVAEACEAMAGDFDTILANTRIFNITGQPAISLPCHWTEDGVPIGVQFAGGFGADDRLLHLSAQLENALNWGDRHRALLRQLSNRHGSG